MNKTCTKCGKTKRLAEFTPHRSYKKSGRKAQCKKCTNESNRILDKSHPEYRRANDRKANLKRLYGITVEEYDAMLEEQKGGCWICGYIPKPGGRRLAVDHDHKTKRTRGLLCHMCNRGLAHFRDKPDRLRRAAYYLSK